MNAPDLKPARERHWICARRLRERRLALGLTQREVVERLRRYGNPISNRALSAMENGRGLDLGLLPELAEVLECSVTYLVGLTTDPADWQPEHRTTQNGRGADHEHRDTVTPMAPPPRAAPIAEPRRPAPARPRDGAAPGPPAPRWPAGIGILGPDVPLGSLGAAAARRREVPPDDRVDQRAAGAS